MSKKLRASANAARRRAEEKGNAERARLKQHAAALAREAGPSPVVKRAQEDFKAAHPVREESKPARKLPRKKTVSKK